MLINITVFMNGSGNVEAFNYLASSNDLMVRNNIFRHAGKGILAVGQSITEYRRRHSRAMKDRTRAGGWDAGGEQPVCGYGFVGVDQQFDGQRVYDPGRGAGIHVDTQHGG